MINKKYAASTIAAMLLVSIGSVSFAATQSTTPTIYYNDKKVATDKAPILKDGTTYVPLRLLAELFGKDVNFDSKTYHIGISDKKDTTSQADDTTAMLQQQIIALQAQVQELKGSIDTIHNQSVISQVTPSTVVPNSIPTSQSQTSTVPATSVPATPVPATPVLSINELQGILNGTDYLYIGSFQLSNIYLSGDSSNITVEMRGDLKANGNNEHWKDDLTQDVVNNYFTKLSKEIRQYYPNATITGQIRNTSYVGLSNDSDPTTTTQYLGSFTSNSSGTVNFNKQY